MSKYSSDTDSDRSSRHRRKHYGRSRSSSSDSSDSCSYKKRLPKHSRSKRRHGTRSKSRDRDRTSRNHRSGRGTSKDREKRRYRSKRSKSCSPDGGGRKGRSPSAEKPRGRSSAARSAVKIIGDGTAFAKDEFSVEPRIEESILREINSESFVPETFFSCAPGKDDRFRNVAIDVSAETVRAPAVKNPTDSTESIFHASITIDREARFDKWVKKLYTLRQKAIAEVTHSNISC